VKWVAVAVLLVNAILAGIAAIEWFTVPIHSLPSFMGQKHIYGHYQKRGAAAALVAFIAVVGAIVLTVRFLRKPVSAQPAASAGDLLSAPPASPPPAGPPPSTPQG